MNPGASLAAAIVQSLDEAALAELARRLSPFLPVANDRSGSAGKAAPLGRMAYTPDTLASELGLSPRTVRAAIQRGELAAVKRGGRWLIGAEAVAVWTAPRPVPRPAVAHAKRRRATGTLAAVVADLEPADDRS